MACISCVGPVFRLGRCKRHYLKQKEMVRVSAQRRRAKFRKAGLCQECGDEKPLPDFQVGAICRERQKVRNKTRAIAIKCRVIQAYGGNCRCCGETESLFLAVHHTHGNGEEHRYMKSSFYSWLESQGFPQDGFMLLCHNCHFGGHLNGGQCPHKDGIRILVSESLLL